jgi:hypothetical protein
MLFVLTSSVQVISIKEQKCTEIYMISIRTKALAHLFEAKGY